MSTGHFPRGSVFSASSKIVVELAARPDGVTCREAVIAIKQQADWCTAKLAKLVASGALYRARQTGHKFHWFTTRSAAADWARRAKKLEPPPTRWGGEPIVLSPSRLKAKQRIFSAERGSVAPGVKIKAPKATQEVIWPEHVKIQRIPSPLEYGPAALVRVQPGTKIKGGFADMGIGRYDDIRD